MRYSIDVRYSECDMQQVVHNSVYLRWCDDLADAFFRDLAVGFDSATWDAMVKAADSSCSAWAATCCACSAKRKCCRRATMWWWRTRRTWVQRG